MSALQSEIHVVTHWSSFAPSLLSIAGSCFILISYFTSSEIRSLPAYYQVALLAVCDLAFSCSALPYWVTGEDSWRCKLQGMVRQPKSARHQRKYSCYHDKPQSASSGI
jgi:hypothetical protein